MSDGFLLIWFFGSGKNKQNCAGKRPPDNRQSFTMPNKINLLTSPVSQVFVTMPTGCRALA